MKSGDDKWQSVAKRFAAAVASVRAKEGEEGTESDKVDNSEDSKEGGKSLPLGTTVYKDSTTFLKVCCSYPFVCLVGCPPALRWN